MKVLVLTSLFSLLITLASCGSAQENESSADSKTANLEYTEKEEYTEDGDTQEALHENQVIERKLIKTGYVAFESEDGKETRKILEESLKKANGFIVEDNLQDDGDEISVELTVRIPSEKFDEFLNGITSHAGELDYRTVNVSDVTEEFIDVEARIKTKKELEKRYIKILESATSVSEMLEIEKQLGYLRSDIESIEGRLRYLKDQVRYSTLTIRYYYDKELSEEEKEEKNVALITFGIVAGVILLILALLWVRNKRKSKN